MSSYQAFDKGIVLYHATFSLPLTTVSQNILNSYLLAGISLENITLTFPLINFVRPDFSEKALIQQL